MDYSSESYKEFLSSIQNPHLRRHPLDREVLDFPLIPADPPLDVTPEDDNLRFHWGVAFHHQFQRVWYEEDISNSFILLMAAMAVELYLDIYAPTRESEMVNPAWRLVDAIIENPSYPKVRDTMREREALLDGYRQFINPWRDNRYIREALGTLLDSAGRMWRQSSGMLGESKTGESMNMTRARAAAIHTIYSAIRALALASNEIQLPSNLAWYENEEFVTNLLAFSQEVFRYWIARWWNRVQRRLSFRDPYTATISGC